MNEFFSHCEEEEEEEEDRGWSFSFFFSLCEMINLATTMMR